MSRKQNPKPEKEPNIKTLETEYLGVVPLAERLGAEIEHQLEQLISERGVVLGIPVQRRTKSWISIREKIERKALKLSGPKELNDLVGLRIIVQFLRDLDIVRGLIREHFEVLDEHDAEGRLREDQFGYNSIHFVVELPETWLAVPTLSEMKGLRAEIQVRTTAQHIWAAASHTLQYKHEESVPVPVRRAIHRVSALLETVDLEFDRVLMERADYRAGLSASSDDKHLNVDVVEEILSSIFPPANREQGEPYEQMLEELKTVGVNSSCALEELLNKHRESALKDEARIVGILRSSQQPEDEDYDYDPERTARGVFYSHVGLARTALGEEFGSQWHSK